MSNIKKIPEMDLSRYLMDYSFLFLFYCFCKCFNYKGIYTYIPPSIVNVAPVI